MASPSCQPVLENDILGFGGKHRDPEGLANSCPLRRRRKFAFLIVCFLVLDKEVDFCFCCVES